MRPLPSPLQSQLDGGNTTLAWCWRLTRADGQVFGFTDHDRALVFDATTFEPESGFSASDLAEAADLAVDAQDAEGVLRSGRITETDILDGRWDGAEVEVWRVDWADPANRVLLRRGAVGEIRRGSAAFVAEMRSLAHVLNQPVGRMFQASCDAALGDARCGVDLTDPAWRGTGTVLSVGRPRAFVAAGLSGFAPGLFALGVLEWTGGANAGRRAAVARHEAGTAGTALVLADEPLRAIAEGDAFSVTAGCDKRIETCAGVFANVPNFRGFPHIPGQDTLLRHGPASAGQGKVR